MKSGRYRNLSLLSFQRWQRLAFARIV